MSARQLAIMPMVFHAARGDLAPLKTALTQALENHLTIGELQEVFTHQAAYAGFPRALDDLIILQELLRERAAQGLNDAAGQPAAALSPATDHYQLGIRNLEYLTGKTPPAVYWNADGMDHSLKAHLFGYLFSRDNLAPVNRELVAIGTLMGLGKSENQLRSHLALRVIWARVKAI